MSGFIDSRVEGREGLEGLDTTVVITDQHCPVRAFFLFRVAVVRDSNIFLAARMALCLCRVMTGNGCGSATKLCVSSIRRNPAALLPLSRTIFQGPATITYVVFEAWYTNSGTIIPGRSNHLSRSSLLISQPSNTLPPPSQSPPSST